MEGVLGLGLVAGCWSGGGGGGVVAVCWLLHVGVFMDSALQGRQEADGRYECSIAVGRCMWCGVHATVGCAC